MLSPEVILEQARSLLSQRQFEQAERLAQRALEVSPSLAPAWLVLAQARRGQNRMEEALAACRHLLTLAPSSPEAHLELAECLFEGGHGQEALAHVRGWVEGPGVPAEALARAGVLLGNRGQLAEAIALMRRAVQASPRDARARNNLGVALAQAGRTAEAIAQLREASRLEGNYVDAWYNLGNVLAEVRQKQEAEQAYREALALKPDHFGVLNNLGLLLQGLSKPGEATVLLRQAVRLRPDAAEARNNLGLALADLGRFEQAEGCYHEALALRPGYSEAHTNLGCALKELGRTEEALACFELALCLEPGLRSARYNRALTLLQAGDWQKGWQEYECRWGRGKQPERPFEKPRWDGSDLAGKTILVWCEQGLGDCVQFVRFASLLKHRGAQVIVECPPPLLALFGSCAGIDELVAEGQTLPSFDLQVPLMSLPGLLTEGAHEVASGPYLSAQNDRVQRWRAVLGPASGLRVGVVWQGNPRFEWDRWRSAPLEAFAPLAGVDGVELVSLQKGAGEEQIEDLRGRFGVRQLEGLDEGEAFQDTAAVLCCLDLLVCVDTSIGHLAGALGVPVWLALSGVSDWRWLREREKSFWYRGHRLFRQEKLGDWSAVFAAMATELRVKVQERERGTVTVQTAAGEVLDRLSILRIKQERFKDETRLAHVRRELATLEHAARVWLGKAQVEGLLARLKGVNERLWDVEDALRNCEAARDFSQRFVELARSVYKINDERGALKRQINTILGAAWSEQKQYGGAGKPAES